MLQETGLVPRAGVPHSTSVVQALQSESSAREPESGKFPKVFRRGCKRSFEPRERKRGCTSAKWGCTGAKRVWDGAKDSWETFAP